MRRNTEQLLHQIAFVFVMNIVFSVRKEENFMYKSGKYHTSVGRHVHRTVPYPLPNKHSVRLMVLRKIHFNIIFPFPTRSYEWHSPSVCVTKYIYCSFSFLYNHPLTPDEVKLQRYWLSSFTETPVTSSVVSPSILSES